MASFALEHLTFTYPGQTRPALDDLTLTVPEGAVTVLCGESGSGKSTLLRQLKTCLTPHGTVSGTVCLGGTRLKDIPFAEQARHQTPQMFYFEFGFVCGIHCNLFYGMIL